MKALKVILKRLRDLLKRLRPKKSADIEKAPGTTTNSMAGPGVKSGYRPRPRQQLIIGLDFGTAFTKVVIGESRISYAVPFPGLAGNGNTYLLPGLLSIDTDGVCRLGSQQGGPRQIENLKMRFLGGDFSASCQAKIAVFLALVLRHSRDWLLTEHKNTYENSDIDWYVNVGLPTDSWHDVKITGIYRTIVQAAWASSISSEPVALASMSKLLNGGMDDAPNLIHPEKIGLFPEFVAQINGYVRSPSRNPGLHALVDVGAGTVDITVFNVHKNDDGDDMFPIFAKCVKPLGVTFLFKHRLDKSNYAGDQKIDSFENPPNAIDCAKMLQTTAEKLQEIDIPFRAELAGAFDEQLNHTRTQQVPLAPTIDHSGNESASFLRQQGEEEEGVPFFICGGGARVAFYADIFQKLASLRKLPHDGKSCKLSVTAIPKPEKLQAENILPEDYHRLSVAYGLSFDALDTGEIRKMNEVEDFTVEAKRECCPGCHGTGGARGTNECSRCGGSGFIYQASR